VSGKNVNPRLATGSPEIRCKQVRNWYILAEAYLAAADLGSYLSV